MLTFPRILKFITLKFKTFSLYLSQLEKTSLRNQMTEILAGLFKDCGSEEIDKICYLCLGKLAPKYAGIEFNMAEKIMVRVLAVAGNQSEAKVEKLYKKAGDLGDTAFKIKDKKLNIKNTDQRPKISISKVYERLYEIAQETGEGSVERKINKMAKLLKEVDGLSAKYIARIPVNKLRLGFSDMTVLDALSWMEKGDKSLRPELERAFNVLADIGKIASLFKTKGIRGIKGIVSQVGVPIRAAQAERLPNAQKILEKMDGQCVLEPKYDGFRIMIHLDKTIKFQLKEEVNLSLFEQKSKFFVQIFSRNLENMTHMFPDIVEAVQKLKVKSTILDGEAIAFNRKTGKFLAFQETVQRKRKHGVDKKSREIPLKVFLFDCLHLNGKSLLNLPFIKRRQILEKILSKSQVEEKSILLTEQKVVSKAKDFDKFFKNVVTEGLEGLMAKKMDAVYQAGARNYNWVKYKAGMQSELADTIDCVVMGYYKGKGKRTIFGIGAFLVGIYDKGKYLTTSKIGTGLTDDQWREIYKRTQSLELKTQSKPEEYAVDKNLYPDVWCLPSLVVEIEADTITRSPIHTAGLALRFPRLKRFRDDKNPEQATSLKELKKLVKITGV